MQYIVQREGDALYHHGIKGMRWGIRRWQNEDGSLTEAGRRHYDIKEVRLAARAARAESRATVKAARIQNKMYEKAQKAQAKEDRKNLKDEKKIAQYESDKMRLELKKMKQEIAYNNGRNFGSAFAPAIGRALGEGVGKIATNTLDPTNWYRMKTERQAANANALNAQTAKNKAKLERDMYDDGYMDRVEKRKAFESSTDRMRANSEHYGRQTDRLKAQDDHAQKQYNLSDEGRERARVKLENESKNAEANLQNAMSTRQKTAYDTSAAGHEHAMAKAKADARKADANVANAEANKIRAEGERAKSIDEGKAARSNAISDWIRAKNEGEIGKVNAEADLNRSRGDEAYRKAEAEGYKTKVYNDADVRKREINARNELELKKEENRHNEAVNQQIADKTIREAEIVAKQNMHYTDKQAETIKQANKYAMEQAKMDYKIKLSQIPTSKGMSWSFESSPAKTTSRQETRVRLFRDARRARNILNSPSATPEQKAEARVVLGRAYSFNDYSANIGDTQIIPIP